MVHRRDVINRLALGGALSAFGVATATASAGGAAQEPAGRVTEELVNSVKAIRDEIARQSSFWEISAVRDQLRTFLRANGKFPDYIDIGMDVWQQIYDWHIRFHQPLALGRTAEGRHTITVMMTTAIMRTDLTPGYIGTPYDAR